jgi:2-oxo-4-hydroxy-4-carboxy-5-ureidoimidazoline decarboxylase
MTAPSPAPAADGRLTISDVNTLSQREFVSRFGPIYEDSPWIAEAAWAARPFTSRADLAAKLAAVVAGAGTDAQLLLIRSHPELVGRAALAGTLGRASTAEQAAAGLDRDALSPDDIDQFAEYNRAYWDRFEFPFVICARENKKDAILTGFRQRLTHDQDEEIATALREIDRIAHYRLADLVREDAAASGTQR